MYICHVLPQWHNLYQLHLVRRHHLQVLHFFRRPLSKHFLSYRINKVLSILVTDARLEAEKAI